jgi:DNA end-binding protein Ku
VTRGQVGEGTQRSFPPENGLASKLFRLRQRTRTLSAVVLAPLGTVHTVPALTGPGTGIGGSVVVVVVVVEVVVVVVVDVVVVRWASGRDGRSELQPTTTRAQAKINAAGRGDTPPNYRRTWPESSTDARSLSGLGRTRVGFESGASRYVTGMARAIWSGTISFGLVNVPVKAFSAVRDHDVHFHQLDRKSGARVRNKRVSEKTGREVQPDDVRMGFEVSKGTYVTFEKGELEELKPTSTRAIEITDFVDLDEIDPIYYERTYWLAPDGDGAKKAYSLLVAAMADRSRVGIGTVVMRNKEYLTAVRPLDNMLAMSTMRFADEVVSRRDIDALPTRATKPDAKAMRMAAQLIDGLTSAWKPDAYHDSYAEDLRRRIKAKDAGDEVVQAEESAAPSGKVLDLMAALEASLEAGKQPRKRAAKARKRVRKSA